MNAIPPPINPQHSRTSESYKAQNKQDARADAQDTSEVKSTIMNAIKDLKEEIQTQKRDPKQSELLDDSATELLEELAESPTQIETNEDQFQKQPDLNTRKGADSPENAAAQAAAEDELERLKKKKSKGQPLMNRLSELAQLEGDFKEFKFKDPEKQQIVNDFFDNMGRIKQLKERLKQLTNMEKRHLEKKEKRPDNS